MRPKADRCINCPTQFVIQATGDEKILVGPVCVCVRVFVAPVCVEGHDNSWLWHLCAGGSGRSLTGRGAGVIASVGFARLFGQMCIVLNIRVEEEGVSVSQDWSENITFL